MSDMVEPDTDAALVIEYELDAPPEKVWRAVTIPALRERWLPDCDLAGAEPCGIREKPPQPANSNTRCLMRAA